jgi:hypothetical protein
MNGGKKSVKCEKNFNGIKLIFSQEIAGFENPPTNN